MKLKSTIHYHEKGDYDNALTDFTQELQVDYKNINALYVSITDKKLNLTEKAYIDFKLAESLGHPFAKKAIKTFLKEDLSK